jgi:hypothetical protein
MKCVRTAQLHRNFPSLCRFAPIFLVATAVWLSAAPARAQNNRTFTEWTIPTAGSEPLLTLPLNGDVIYFTERTASKIGKLELTTNVITEWALPLAVSDPHELIQVGNRIFFCEQGNFVASTGAIGALNPGTGQLTEWTVTSTAFPVPEHLLRIGKSIYFTEQFADRIGSLNPSTNAIQEWPLPFGGGSFNLNGMALDQNGNSIWLVELIANRVARFDLATNTLTEWQLPIATRALNHVYIQERFAYFTDGSGNAIFRLDPTTNTFKVWTDPTPPNAFVTGLSLTEIGEGRNEVNEPIRVTFGEFSGNNVGQYVSTVAPSTDYYVIPTSTIITPVDSTATVASSTPVKTVTQVTPVTTVVPSVTNGAYTFWPIPTAAAGFGEFASSVGGGLFFTERTGNKIGLFTR